MGCRKLWTPTVKERSDAGFEKETNVWPEENVEASKREHSGSKKLQREFTRQEVKECAAKLTNKTTAAADKIANEILKD